MTHDGKEGNIKVDCIPGSEIAVVSWDTGDNTSTRVYSQMVELACESRSACGSKEIGLLQADDSPGLIEGCE